MSKKLKKNRFRKKRKAVDKVEAHQGKGNFKKMFQQIKKGISKRKNQKQSFSQYPSQDQDMQKQNEGLEIQKKDQRSSTNKHQQQLIKKINSSKTSEEFLSNILRYNLDRICQKKKCHHFLNIFITLTQILKRQQYKEIPQYNLLVQKSKRYMKLFKNVYNDINDQIKKLKAQQIEQKKLFQKRKKQVYISGFKKLLLLQLRKIQSRIREPQLQTFFIEFKKNMGINEEANIQDPLNYDNLEKKNDQRNQFPKQIQLINYLSDFSQLQNQKQKQQSLWQQVSRYLQIGFFVL